MTRNRRSRMIKAAREGHPPVEIARRYVISPNAVSNVFSRARKRGEHVPTFAGNVRGKVTVLFLPRATASMLRKDAKRRGMSPRNLASSILTAVMRNGLLPEILGDGDAR